MIFGIRALTRSAILLVVSLGFGVDCNADPPATSYIFPAGGQRGTTVGTRVGGLNLSAECGFRMLGGGIESPAKISSMPTLVLIGPYHHNPIAQQQWDYPKDMAAAIKIAPDATLGSRSWYCTTAEGATQLRVFVVGDLPEVMEDEEKTGPGRPQQVATPVTINGRIYPRADLDEFVFAGKAGQHVACEVMSQRLGHKLDAKLELHDSAGRPVAESDDHAGRDPLLAATLPADGNYVLRIHDIAFEGDQDYVYRLTIRGGPHITHAFPAGARRGATTAVRFYGSGMGADGFVDKQIALPSTLPFTADLAATSGGQRAIPGTMMSSLVAAAPPAAGSATPAAGSLNATVLDGLHVSCAFQVAEGAEVVEIEPNDDAAHAQHVALPAVLNGQLFAVGDVDEYAFTARKGEPWDIEFFGRRLGSPITGVCTVLDAAGKQLARQEGDTRFTFAAPADGEFRLRVHELHRETHGGSDFIYRIVAAPPQPDFRLVLDRDNLGVPPGQTAKLKLNVVRAGGFQGDIQLAASDLPPGVTFAAPAIAGNQNQVELTFTAPIDAPIGETRRALVIGAATVNGQRLLHTAEAAGATGGGQLSPVDSLAVTVVHPPLFAINTEEVFGNANRGATFVQKFTIERQPGFDGEVTLSVADHQTRYLQGATGPTVVVKPGQKEIDYPAFFPEVMDLNRTARVLLMGTAKVTDASAKVHYVTHTTQKQIVVRVSPSLMTLASDLDLLELSPGKTVDVSLRLSRTPELAGPVTVTAVLPADIKGFTATTATMSADQGIANVSLQLAADAQLGQHDRITFRATAQRDGHPVVAETSLEVQLEPAAIR